MDVVEKMLALRKQLAKVQAPHDKTVPLGQLAASDGQIDPLVYDWYQSTEEIKIVEQER